MKQSKVEYLNNIKKVMALRNLNVEGLALMLHKSPQYVYHKLNGIRKFKVDELLEWCRALEITPDALFMEIGEGSELEEFLANLMWAKRLPPAQRRRLLKFGVMAYEEMMKGQRNERPED